MNAEQLVQQWGDYLKHERRASDHTRSAYARDIALFLNGQELEIDALLSKRHIRHIIAEQSRQGRKSTSIARSLSALRSFCKWAVRHGALPTDFHFPDVQIPKQRRRLPKVMDVDTTSAVVEVKGHSVKQVRDRAIFELLYGLGLRVSELSALKLSDIDRSSGLCRVLGKGNKQREVPLGKEASASLVKWLSMRSELSPTHDFVFLNLRDRGAITTRGIQHIVKERGKAAGFDIDLHPHLFRHAFASHILESSKDLRGVQELLGHENLSTTQVYTHLNFQHLAEVYDQSHPRAKKK